MTGNPLANKLVSLLQNAGVSITSAQLEASAAQVSTLTNNLLAPAFIWTVIQLWENFPTVTSGLVYPTVGKPTFTPASTGAIAIDIVTRQKWNYTNTQGWT